MLREWEIDTFNKVIEKVIEKEGKESALCKLKAFIEVIENEKIESEEFQYILDLTKEN